MILGLPDDARADGVEFDATESGGADHPDPSGAESSTAE